MTTILIIIFLGMIAVDIWTAFLMLLKFEGKWLFAVYLFVVFVAFIATILMTYYFSYYPNPNTHIFGWPISRVIFQRDSAISPWLDYVGPTIVLAYPMNFVIYQFFPSVVFLFFDFLEKENINFRDKNFSNCLLLSAPTIL